MGLPGTTTQPSSATHSTWRAWTRQLAGVYRLSVPLGIVQVGYHLTGAVDTAIAGRVDEITVAATGLGAAFFFVVAIFGIGIALGVDPMAAQAFGSNDPTRARTALWQGLYVTVLVTFPLTLVTIGASACLEVFGVEAALSNQTRAYIYGRLPSLLPLLASVAMRSFLQAAHITRPIVISTITTNIFNFVADWLLIFGDEGLVSLGLPAIGMPRLGVAGIGWASTVATLAQAGVLIFALRAAGMPAGPPIWRQRRARVMARIFRIGWPVGLQLTTEVGIFAAVGVLMSGMSALAMASHQVALMIASLTFSACLGIGAATSVQVGRAIGAGDRDAMRRAGVSGIGLGVVFMMLPALLMWFVPEHLARIMTDDADVIPAATTLLRVAGVFQLADGAQAVASGALRGAGATHWPLFANLFGHWAVGMPVGIFLAYGLDWGPVGLWWGLTAGLAAVAIGLTAKFLSLSAQPIESLRVDEESIAHL